MLYGTQKKYCFLTIISNQFKGAAFAAQALSESSGNEALKPHLNSLIPKLYRSAFDPSFHIADSMVF